MRARLALILATAALVATACATVPPKRPVQDLAGAAGVWQGTVNVPAAGTPYTLRIAPNGTWAARTPTEEFNGTVEAVGNTLRWRSETTGRTGTWVLHEGDGARALVVWTEALGAPVGVLRPAK